MLRITTTLLAAAALLLGCPEAQTTECSPKAGECPNYCTDGTGVAGESCAGPSDCGCGLACISGSCTAYTGANEGCGCPSQPQPDAAADAGVPDTPAPDTGPTVQPWDDGCDKIVEGADCTHTARLAATRPTATARSPEIISSVGPSARSPSTASAPTAPTARRA